MAVSVGGSGGFVALNKGNIKDCYSTVKTYANNKSAGFCGINTGYIKNCYSKGLVKKQGGNYKYGLCAKQNGTIIDSFWIYNKKCKDSEECIKGISLYKDKEFGLDKETLKKDYKSILANWDTKDTWGIIEENDEINLRLYSESEKNNNKKVVEIASKSDLLSAVEDINSGAVNDDVIFKLVSDINLGGGSSGYL